MSNKDIHGYRKDLNGWSYINIYGDAYERGYAYGYLCGDMFAKIQSMLNFLIMESYGVEWSYIIKQVSNDFKSMIHRKYKEYYDEINGIADGCNASHLCSTTFDEILAWNFYCSIPYWYASASTGNKRVVGKEGGSIVPQDHCSAFMATGDWTKDGKIVCAHNSFSDFIDGQWAKVILHCNPSSGVSFIMQTSPCWIWSGTDFFVTKSGIIGTETTYGGFTSYTKKVPIFCRIRYAMQYGTTLDEYCSILLKDNSGDYANAWLFGDINSNEIMRLELGLKYHNIEKTLNGYFIGFNAPYDERIRNHEVQNSGFYDIRRHQGARYVRLNDLMDKYKGKLDVNIAKKIISDHYDVYLKKSNNPCSRTVCSHYELDGREYMSQESRPVPYSPRGALDGLITTSNLASKMIIVGRYGNSCGMPFKVNQFCKEHRQWEKFCPYIFDRPSEPWTIFPLQKVSKPIGSTKRKKTERKRKRKTIRKVIRNS